MDKNSFIKLGKSIISGRKKLGLSQKQLAKKVSISPSCLSMIELGKTNTSVFTVYKIGKLLNANIFNNLD